MAVILVSVAVVVLLLVLWLATKFILRLVVLLCVIAIGFGYLYFNKIGPFNSESLDMSLIKNNYCSDDGDDDVCECIVQMAEEQLMTSYQNDILGVQKAFIKSAKQSIECLKKRNAEEKYVQFIQETMGVKHNILGDSLSLKAEKFNLKMKETLEKVSSQIN